MCNLLKSGLLSSDTHLFFIHSCLFTARVPGGSQSSHRHSSGHGNYHNVAVSGNRGFTKGPGGHSYRSAKANRMKRGEERTA